MAKKFPPRPSCYDEQQLNTLSASLHQVSAALKARGINLESDSSLLEEVLNDLLSKVSEGECDQQVLAQYTLLKAWSRIRNIEGSRLDQLYKLRKPFTEQR